MARSSVRRAGRSAPSVLPRAPRAVIVTVSTNVLADPAVRDGIKQYTNWPTIPQLYVKGEFIGGCDILKEMFENGELKDLFAEKGIALAAS